VNPKDDLGRTGEQVAAEYLERAGLRVLDRNWRSATGEIDIVATERRVLVVCEVKTRSGTGFGTPLEAITPPAGPVQRRGGGAGTGPAGGRGADPGRLARLAAR
jgi:putative endonuclease